MKTARQSPAKKAPLKTVSQSKSFPIVAIGASAGGLEAISELLKNVTPDTGMAFIYVQHLSPDHKSMLTSLLAKATDMKVQEVKNKVAILPNNVYVIPPDKEMHVTQKLIRLSPRPDSPKFNLPIDILFSSLAKTHKANVIGIILSGSASDGTLGLKTIKHMGGITFAQDNSAKFGSMPKSAIATGVVDFILSPKKIALELNRLSKHPFLNSKISGRIDSELIEDNNLELENIINEIHKVTGVDFSVYKMQTVKRRIQRRMLLYKIRSLKEYSKLVLTKNEEIEILFQDLLINVTSFFRDSDSYKYLRITLLPKLIKSKKAGDSLRIWVPACSTGEEAYSIAMMISEIKENLSVDIPVQIFATDLSEKAIQKARIGTYSKNELASVSPKRIQRFFNASDGEYRVRKALRNICVFAPHNILSDPPFSKIDLISCRNLFIYLDNLAQKRAISTFHYALNDNGYLMLGKAEALSSAPSLFTAENKALKVFKRKKNSNIRAMPPLLPRRSLPQKNKDITARIIANDSLLVPLKQKIYKTNLEETIDAVLISQYMPASVVINYQMDILQFRGNTDLFLTHTSGKANLNVLRMLRPEIAFVVRNAISKSIHTKERIRVSDLEINLKQIRKSICIEVLPLKINWEEPLLLVVFTEQEIKEVFESKGKQNKKLEQKKDKRIKQLLEELAMAKADALAYSQEQDEFIEELQSSNEEVVSSNEELQTVNEELETSKEEIESTNEELISTNQELQTRNELLNESYEYSNAIIGTLHEPMIVLDKNLRIKTASKSFYKKFGVKELETEGMLLYDIGNRQWDINELRILLEEIIPKNSYFHDFKVKHTFPGIGEKVLMLNASQISQKSHGEKLILLSFRDITDAVSIQLKEQELLKKDLEYRNNYNLKLEMAVKASTKELKESNQNLEEKNNELKKMNKELEAFAYVSSHDLQEPLRKIQTFAGRILDTENKNLSNSGQSYFWYILNSAERMQSLIEDLLTFSRVSTTQRKFESHELKQIIGDVTSELKDKIQENRATIQLTGNCKLRIIPFQFRQALYNLFSNAFKFAKTGHPPKITINCRIMPTLENAKLRLPDKIEYTHISFIDQGIGFDQRYSEKIFEVFEKLHSKDEYAGTGIGLAIVKKIIENHDGIINAHSRKNKGTIFNLYIPAS